MQSYQNCYNNTNWHSTATLKTWYDENKIMINNNTIWWIISRQIYTCTYSWKHWNILFTFSLCSFCTQPEIRLIFQISTHFHFLQYLDTCKNMINDTVVMDSGWLTAILLSMSMGHIQWYLFSFYIVCFNNILFIFAFMLYTLFHITICSVMNMMVWQWSRTCLACIQTIRILHYLGCLSIPWTQRTYLHYWCSC